MSRLSATVAVLIGASLALEAWGEEPWTPLNELGKRAYQGKVGGLYAEGRNEPWGPHAEALQRISVKVVPLDAQGQPDAAGKIVVAGIGASVCRQIFVELEQLGPQTKGKSDAVTFVNCALGGADVNKIADESGRYWEMAAKALAAKDLTPAQVQVVWHQSDDLSDQRADFPGRPERLKESFAAQLRMLKTRFPNVRVCYFSGRHTTAFIPEGGAEKHREPRPYHHGWAVKWLIEEQSQGRADLKFDGPRAAAPLAAWATYFWTNSEAPRADGYAFTRDDVVKDGVHLSQTARPRVAKELLAFFATDKHAKTWFATPPSTPIAGKQAEASDPAWIINGVNKMPKLTRLLGTTENVRVVVHNLEGKQVGEIRDVFRRHTDLVKAVGPGQYRLEFYDSQGQRIKLTQEVGEVLRLK